VELVFLDNRLKSKSGTCLFFFDSHHHGRNAVVAITIFIFYDGDSYTTGTFHMWFLAHTNSTFIQSRLLMLIIDSGRFTLQ
jgi:hypothetical protein